MLRYLSIFFILTSMAFSSGLLQHEMLHKDETVYFDPLKVPPYVQGNIDSHFRALLENRTPFEYYGTSSPSFSHTEAMVRDLALNSHGVDVYIMDIGAGDGSFGNRIYDYVNSQQFTNFLDHHSIGNIKFHIISLVGEMKGSKLRWSPRANSYYLSLFKIENLDREFEFSKSVNTVSNLDEIPVDNCGDQNIQEAINAKIQKVEKEDRDEDDHSYLKQRWLEFFIKKDAAEKLKNLHGKIDWIVSSLCFIHLADPLGTFVRGFNMLRPGSGIIEIDGFYLITQNTIQDKRNDHLLRKDFIDIIRSAQQPYLMKAGSHGKVSILMQRKDDQLLRLPVQYKGSVYAKYAHTKGDSLTLYEIDPLKNEEWKSVEYSLKPDDYNIIFGESLSFMKSLAHRFEEFSHTIVQWKPILKNTSEKEQVFAVWFDEELFQDTYLSIEETSYDFLIEHYRASFEKIFGSHSAGNKVDLFRYAYLCEEKNYKDLLQFLSKKRVEVKKDIQEGLEKLTAMESEYAIFSKDVFDSEGPKVFDLETYSDLRKKVEELYATLVANFSMLTTPEKVSEAYQQICSLETMDWYACDSSEDVNELAILGFNHDLLYADQLEKIRSFVHKLKRLFYDIHSINPYIRTLKNIDTEMENIRLYAIRTVGP